MGLDGEEHLLDADGLDLLGLYGRLDEHLGVDVVVVLRNKVAHVSQEEHNIDTLLKLLCR